MPSRRARALLVLVSSSLAAVAALGAVAAHHGTAGAAGPPPMPRAAPPPDPSAWHLVRHVRTQAYYGLNDLNADVPPAFMARYVDIAEDDGYTAEHADRFKRAGGAAAIAYTDPTYAAHCPPPFTPPAGKCEGQIAKLVATDERAFVHDASGARVHRFNDPYFQYQEVFNVTQPVVWRAYAAQTADILRHSPLLDGFEADDSGSPFTGTDGKLGSNLYEYYSGFGVEIRSDEEYIAGATAMLRAAGKPLMINGGDPRGTGPAYGGRFLDLPFVTSQQHEGCFNNGGRYLYSDKDDKFRREQTSLLTVMSHRKSAVCYPTGDTTPPHRLYAYASWLLTYDPRYSVYLMAVKQSDGEALYPEIELVPLLPRQTPGSIDDLRRGPLYVREFGACAIGGSSIGSCAAIVNPSDQVVPVPSLAVKYARHVALDPQSLYHGGKARAENGAPAALAPQTATILVR
jgi:hypothetical protein